MVVRLLSLAVLVLAGLLGPSAVAQPGPGGGGRGAAGPDTGGTGEVTIQVSQIGLGNAPRAGEWVGIQMVLTDRAATPRDLAVRLALRDSDGDIPLYQRVVASTPGTRQSVWVYCWLPFDTVDNDTLTIRVNAADSAAATGDGAAAGIGDLLGETKVQVRNLLPAIKGSMAVVGQVPVGFSLYGEFDPSLGLALPVGHEVQQIIGQLAPAQLPDRWMGYSGLSALVWTAAGDGQPSQMLEPQAAALREWVNRGGHLIIVLPTIGQQWLTPANPLLDIMPRVRAERVEGVDYADFRRILRREPAQGDAAPIFPRSYIAHWLEPEAGVRPEEAMRILAAPGTGKGLVVRRLVGVGAVTMIGLDVVTSGLAASGLQPDIFWHRVLGRRGELPTPAQIQQRANRGRQTFARRDEVRLDAGIASQINKEGAAAAGLLLAFVVFLAYWAVAGPLGFGLLKVRNQTAWAWVGFVGTTAVFTALAWGGANLLKPRRVEARHLTVVQHVYGQPVQRARSWMSVLLPVYGTMTVAVKPNEQGTAGAGFHNLLTAWSPPPDLLGGSSGFNDARSYIVSARDPRQIEFPSRSTVKTVRVDWAGGSTWKMPVPTSAADAPRLTTGLPGQRTWRLTGKLTHELPGGLRDVEIVVVRQQLDLVRRPLENQLLVEASAWSLGEAWEPGKPLDLEQVTAPRPGGGAAEALGSIIDNRLIFAPDRADRGLGGGDVEKRFMALALFGLLTPPDTTERALQIRQATYLRESMHGFDLSRWVTQPCIIVMGHIVDGPAPVPMLVDDEPLPTEGRTVVWWVYPLPESPPKTPEEQP
jgi:hypothetical protein